MLVNSARGSESDGGSQREDSSRVVLHYRDVYSGETFIDYLLGSLSRYRPVMLTRESRVPPAGTGAIETLPRIHYPEFKLNRLWERCFGRRLFLNRFAYRKAFNKHNPVLIHCHFGNDAALMAPIARSFGIPLIASFYGFDLSLPAQRSSWLKAYRYLFAYAGMIVVEGPEMKRSVISLGCAPEKVEIVRLGFPLNRFARRLEGRSEPQKAFQILMCCRLVEKKGVLDAIRAFHLVRQQADAELTIIGDGPMRASVERLVADLELKSTVTLRGRRPLAEFYEALLESDCFLQPSLTAKFGETEGGAPTTLVEAQLHGVPIVATRHADIPFVVSPLAAEMLCDERDVQGIAAALLRLIAQPELRCQLSAEGRQFAEAHHSSTVTGSQIEAIYDRVSSRSQ